MAQDYRVHDGYRDPVTDELLGYTDGVPPRRVTITPKNPNSDFFFPDNFGSWEGVSAIDYGTGEPLPQYPNVPSSAPAGERIHVYFNMQAQGQLFFKDEWSMLLSQIATLHNSFPSTVNIDTGERFEIVIDSPDFKALEGIWNSSNTVNNPTFFGSTFKVGPRIWGDDMMQATNVWPPYGGWDGVYYSPFSGLTVESIDYQGDLSERCERINPSTFIYTDPDGYERVDAYPSGAKPVIIDHAIGPLGRFEMDSGSKFPVWDTTNLEVCIKPVVAQMVVLPTRSASISLPLGPDPRMAHGLKRYTNGIEDISTGYDDDGNKMDLPLVTGLKILGIDMPDSCEYMVNTHFLFRNQATLNEEDDFKIGFVATPKTVKFAVNFNLGMALQQLFSGDEDEILMAPQVPENAIYVNRYYEVNNDDISGLNGYSPWYWVTVKADSSITGIEVPKITAPNLKWLDGYCESIFSHGRTGDIAFTVPGGASYSGTVKHKVPAAPHHEGIIIRNHRRYMAAYVSGSGHSYSTRTPADAMQLAYGRLSDQNNPTPVAVFNVDGAFFNDNLDDGSVGPSPQLKEFKDMIDPANFEKLKEMAEGRLELDAEYTLNLSQDSFELETFDTSGIAYAIGWEDGVFYNAQVDPETIPNILTPIAASKVDGAYRYALAVATPLYSTVRYLDNYQLNEPSKTVPGGSYTPSYTMILGFGVPKGLADQYVYKIENIDIPDFQLTDDGESVYDTWDSIFSYLIWGDIEGFKTAHGIDPSTEIGGSTEAPKVAAADGLGLGVLNWKQLKVGTATWQAIMPPSINPPFGRGQRAFGARLFREEIPYYPGEAPLYGDPIFLDFSKAVDNQVWKSGDIALLRSLLAPSRPIL